MNAGSQEEEAGSHFYLLVFQITPFGVFRNRLERSKRRNSRISHVKRRPKKVPGELGVFASLSLGLSFSLSSLLL